MTFRDTVADALLPVILANGHRLPQRLVSIAAVLDGYRAYWLPEYAKSGGMITFLRGSVRAEHHGRYLSAQVTYYRTVAEFADILKNLGMPEG